MFLFFLMATLDFVRWCARIVVGVRVCVIDSVVAVCLCVCVDYQRLWFYISMPCN